MCTRGPFILRSRPHTLHRITRTHWATAPRACSSSTSSHTHLDMTCAGSGGPTNQRLTSCVDSLLDADLWTYLVICIPILSNGLRSQLSLCVHRGDPPVDSPTWTPPVVHKSQKSATPLTIETRHRSHHGEQCAVGRAEGREIGRRSATAIDSCLY